MPAAQRLIKGSTLDLALTMMHAHAGGEQGADPFNPSRRVEQIWLDRRDWLDEGSSGYGHWLEAAQIPLKELQCFGPLSMALVAAIEAQIRLRDWKDNYAAF